METRLLEILNKIKYTAETSNPVIYDYSIEAIAILEEIIDIQDFTIKLYESMRQTEREAIVKDHFEKIKN